MIGVGNIIVIRDIRNPAKTLLQAFGKFVCGGFQRCPVNRIINVLRFLPFVAGIVQSLHDRQRKGLRLRIGMAFPRHIFAHLIKTCIAQRDRGIAMIQKCIDGLSLFQSGNGPVLPQDGCHVAQRSKQSLMPASKCLVAKFQPLIQNLPEFLFVPTGRAGDIHQIDGHHSLIEAAVILVFFSCRRKTIRCQEGAAAHAGIDVTSLVFLHFFGRNIIRHHALCRTFGRQHREIPVLGSLSDIILV